MVVRLPISGRLSAVRPVESLPPGDPVCLRLTADQFTQLRLREVGCSLVTDMDGRAVDDGVPLRAPAHPPGHAQPDDNSGEPPHDAKEEGLHQELDKNVPAPRTHSHPEPHLVPAFPDRKEHDREDSDPAQQ